MGDRIDLTRDLPWTDFISAAGPALAVLQGRLGMDVWLVTEVVDGFQRVLASHPSGAFAVGDALPWRESFCVRMVSGEGPRFAPVVAAEPVYAGLREGPAARVASYIGVPLLRPDGSLFGTVCGYGFRAQSPALARQLPVVELTARLLASLLAVDGAGPRRPAVPTQLSGRAAR